MTRIFYPKLYIIPMYRYNMNKIIMTTVIAAILVATTATTAQVQAKNNILNDFGNALTQGGDGASAGQDKARSDYRAGNVYDDSCDSNGNPAWCVGYAAGYAAGWNGLASSGEPRGDDGEFESNDD